MARFCGKCGAKLDEATGQYIHTVSYDFAGNNYPYFKLVNKTRAAFYAESITVTYKK